MSTSKESLLPNGGTEKPEKAVEAEKVCKPKADENVVVLCSPEGPSPKYMEIHRRNGMPDPQVKSEKSKFRKLTRGCLTLRHLVMAYAALFLIVKAFQFGKGIKHSVDMLLVYSNSPPAYYHILHERSKRVLFMPSVKHHPENPHKSSHHHDPHIYPVLSEDQIRMDTHIWGGFLLLKCLEYLFAWLLIFSVKNKVYLGVITWLAFAIPTFCFYSLKLLMDLLLRDLFHRGEVMRGDSSVELLLQAATILMAIVFLRQYVKGSSSYQLISGNGRERDPTWQINLRSVRNPIVVL